MDKANRSRENTTTDANGEYVFTLAPGTYTVSEVAPTGSTQTAGGATFTLTSGEEAVSYAGEAGTLLPGQTEVLTAGLAFGNYEQASVNGYKFNDLNDSGVDSGDPRVAGVSVLLIGTNGQGHAVSESTTTGTTASMRSLPWHRERTQ